MSSRRKEQAMCGRCTAHVHTSTGSGYSLRYSIALSALSRALMCCAVRAARCSASQSFIWLHRRVCCCTAWLSPNSKALQRHDMRTDSKHIFASLRILTGHADGQVHRLYNAASNAPVDSAALSSLTLPVCSSKRETRYVIRINTCQSYRQPE
jgi:hypothetical protein